MKLTIHCDNVEYPHRKPPLPRSSSLLRERIISQAKTGTAPVQPYILMEAPFTPRSPALGLLGREVVLES